MNTLTNTLRDISAKLNRNDVPECEFIPCPDSLPNMDSIKELVGVAKAVFFPHIFGDMKDMREDGMNKQVEHLFTLLNSQIYSSLCSDNKLVEPQTATDLTLAFIGKLPEIKRLLATDIKAMLDSDPAAINCSEVIFCYPAVLAMLHYRMAHELLMLQIPLLPRIITELAHSATGIDIHPAAKIGEYFSIDHGTGVVIGETCVIGNRVRLYQGVTLGAKGFVYDDHGLPMNVPRHPIIEDNVVIYSNSTILGRITIGHDSVIGGNIWQVFSVPPHSRIVQKKAITSFTDGGGI
ncbi:serine acetyltransferase [Bacteroidia bacterium]|nr:serine acetyltransferase [Bacteroidia bacterium]